MPYGYSYQEWKEKRGEDKHFIRKWAIEKFQNEKDPSLPTDFEVLQPLLKTGITKDIQTYISGDSKYGILIDEKLGEVYIHNKGANKWFGNTVKALNQDEVREAEQEWRDIQDATKKKYPSALDNLTKYGYRSFSGCDITPSITIGPKTFIIGNVSTISYSIHRDKLPVRTCGRSYPKGYTNGPRTIAGSLIFTVFDTHVLHEIREAMVGEFEPGKPSPLTDQLPPFDVSINFQNEYGEAAYMRIYGIGVVDESQTHSINDLLTENVMQFVARDIDLMCKLGGEWTPQMLAATNSPIVYSSKEAEKYNQQINYIRKEIFNIGKRMLTLQNNIVRYRELKKHEEDESNITEYEELIDENRNEKAKLAGELANLRKKLWKALNDNPTKQSELDSDRIMYGSHSSKYHNNPYNMIRPKDI